jgi:hypothetical protein
MACIDCNDNCRQGRDCPHRTQYELTFVIKWLLGIVSLALFPFALVLGVIVCMIYYIPVTIGGWVYDFVKRMMK